MKVAITGASGFLGQLIGRALEAGGHAVVSIGRSASNNVEWDPPGGRLDPKALQGIEAVIHLAGESIGGDRLLGPQWTAAKKKAILESRIDGTGLIAGTIAQMDTPPSVLISSSAQGYYGDRGDEVLTEDSGPGDTFFADVCVAWEEATAPAAEAGIRVVTTRTGIVVSDEAEAFRRLLVPAKFGSGALGSGSQWWSFVSITDLIRVFMRAVEDPSLSGPINLVSPEPMRQADFARALGARIGRPAFLPAPAFGLKLVLGKDFVDNVLLASTRLVPTKLLEQGFEFSHPTVAGMLSAELR